MPTEGTYYTQENLQPADWAIVPLPRAESPADLAERQMELVLVLARKGEGNATTFTTINRNLVIVNRTVEGLFPQCEAATRRHPKRRDMVPPQRPMLDASFFPTELRVRPHLAGMADDANCEWRREAEEACDQLNMRDYEPSMIEARQRFQDQKAMA